MSLAVDTLAFAYPGADVPLFSGVSFRLAEPGFHSFFGPSGVGKTTLARIIAGDIAAFSGEIDAGDLARSLYSHNKERLPGWSGVARHLERVVAPDLHGRMAELIAIFGLDECIDSRFDQLSMGQQNRVNLIRYLLQDCDLLIMDESLANVDERTREKIILAIKAMFPQRYFIYISHNVIEVAKFCQDILVFRGRGKQPQTALVRGCDMRREGDFSRAALDATLLEIMNAA